LAGSLHNELKSITHGFASFDWEEGEYRPADLRRLDIIAHGKPVDALARLVHKDEAVSLGRGLIAKMKELVPRAQFEIVLQAAVDGKVVARETIKPLRKDGALLLVDAGQGVQAQTLANWRLARDQGLVVVTALNKIDLPQADPEACVRQLQEAGGLREGEQVLQLSAKTGQGVAELLPTLI
ncbi:GTP binding protein LepA, partial [Haematococcus lacustris]